MYMSDMVDVVQKAKIGSFSDRLGFVSVKSRLWKKSDFVVSINDDPSKPQAFNSRGYKTLELVEKEIANKNCVAQVMRQENRLMYWDIDKILLTDEQFCNFITNDFIRVLNDEIAPSSITLSDLQIHTKLDVGKDCDKIKSFHIICTKYSMNNLQNKALAQNMKTILGKIDVVKDIDVDDSVYKPNGRLYNCFSGKIGGNLFQYHPINTKPYELLWIDRPYDCDEIEYNKQIVCEIIPITKDTLEYIMEHKKKYMSSTRKWKNVCGYVKAGGFMTREDFCEKSIVGKWKYKQNLVAWDEYDTTYAYKDIDRLTEVLSCEKLVPNPINNTFFKFIKASEDLQNKFRACDDSLVGDTIYVDDIIFDKETGVLQRPNQPTILYFQECFNQMRPTTSGTTMYLKRNDITDQFLYDTKHLFINGIYGCGKTSTIISPIIKSAIKHNKLCDENGSINRLSVLVITENNSLNKQYQADKSLQLTSHLIDKNCEFQVCSLESLARLKIKTYNIIILDEYVTLMGHFLSDKTMRKQEIIIYKQLINYLRNADRVIVCDADLSHQTYPQVLDCITKERIIHKIVIDKYVDYKYVLVFQHQIIYKRIKNDLNNNKRVVVAFDIAKRATAYMETLCGNSTASYKILSVIAEDGSDGWKINNEALTNEQSLAVTENLGDFIRNEKIDIMIYSPKITTGVSINDKCFDCQYGIATGKSVTARQFVQMIHRARELTNKTIYIAVPNPRAKTDLSYIDGDYMEKQLQSGTIALKQIVQKELSDDTRIGLTEIISQAQAEQERSRKCFTSELYNQLKSLGLTIDIVCVDDMSDIENQPINDTIKDVNYWLENGLMTLSEIENMIRSEKNGAILNKQQHINKHYLHIFLKATITYTIDTKSDDPNQPIIEKLETYHFNGLFPYDFLHGIYPSLTNIEVRNYTKFKIIKERLISFNHELEMSDREIMEKYKEHYKTTSDNVIHLEMKKHIAFHFYRMFKKLKNKAGLIDKKLLCFTNEQLMVINYLQHKTKLTNQTKIADVMIAISRIIREYFGVSFKVCNANRNCYIEKPNEYILADDYESSFRRRMEELNINISTIVCRSPIKDKIVSVSPTTNDLGGYLSRKENTRNRNKLTEIYDTKHDIHKNKIVNRKMSGTPYATAPMYRDIVPTGKMEEHYCGAEPNIDKVDIPITTDVMTYEYPIIPKDKLDLMNVYEPAPNFKTRQLSRRNTAPNANDNFMVLKRDVGRKELLEAKVPIKLDIGEAKPTGRNDFLLKDLKFHLGSMISNKNDWEIFEEGDIVFVEYNPSVKINVYDRENYSNIHNQEKSVYYFIFDSSYTEPLTLYHAYVRNGYDIECDYEATDKMIDCHYIDYKMHSVSRVIDQIVPNNIVEMPYNIDGHQVHSVYYGDLVKSPSHTIINSGKNRRYFKHKEPSADENMMRERVASNETMMRYILKNWRKSIDYKLGAKKPLIRQETRTKSTAVINPIIEKIKPKSNQVVHIEVPEPTESDIAEIRKIKKRQSRDAVKSWVNGIQIHMKEIAV